MGNSPAPADFLGLGWGSWLDLQVQNPGPGNSEEKGLAWGAWEPMIREHSAINVQTCLLTLDHSSVD